MGRNLVDLSAASARPVRRTTFMRLFLDGELLGKRSLRLSKYEPASSITRNLQRFVQGILGRAPIVPFSISISDDCHCFPVERSVLILSRGLQQSLVPISGRALTSRHLPNQILDGIDWIPKQMEDHQILDREAQWRTGKGGYKLQQWQLPRRYASPYVRSGVKRPIRASNSGARFLSQRSILRGRGASLGQKQPGIIGASSLNALRVVPEAGELEMGLAGTIPPPGIRAIVCDVRRDMAAVNGHDGPVAASDCLALR